MLKKETDSTLLQYALEYFEKYIQIDTMSDESNPNCPSNPRILDLAKIIVDDLQSLGLEASVDEHAYVYASLPGNRESNSVLGFIAHMDSSPDFPASPMRARRVSYSEEGIILNQEHPSYLAKDEEAIILSEDVFPQLEALRGQDIIVSDGHTLLSADNKAGLAEIMAVSKYLILHPEIPHGSIKIAFTPDEEIGRGADLFDVTAFGANYAFTIDGGAIGEVEWENFNAASAYIRIKGRNVHPGSAKDKMINALLLASEFALALPSRQRPEHTEGYEGFYHLNDLKGNVELAEMSYIIRDFDKEDFEAKKEHMLAIADDINNRLGFSSIEVTIHDSYYNMREKIAEAIFLIDYAKEAMEEVGVTPQEVPIRGGTDGARLSFMGLPCPNLFTGGDNFHGRYEYLAVETMEKAMQTIIQLVQKF